MLLLWVLLAERRYIRWTDVENIAIRQHFHKYIFEGGSRGMSFYCVYAWSVSVLESVVFLGSWSS